MDPGRRVGFSLFVPLISISNLINCHHYNNYPFLGLLLIMGVVRLILRYVLVLDAHKVISHNRADYVWLHFTILGTVVME